MYSIPQYPIYSGLVDLYGGRSVHYYLNEEENWNISYDELVKRYEKAINQGTKIKAIVVINPGNPTGSVMSRESLEELV